ncbi:MAG TPA: hypothetical protein VGO63_01490 [Candidatus Paceibacterota bacterium]|jgi:hypothetical protein|nr:hypothetical protein [Candidatus Paceibacterota bacterium]
MTWALKRQILYVLILIIFFGGAGFLIIYPKLTKAPTCTDSKQNGTETGVDCGGSCAKACINQVDALSVLWSRIFRVVPGRYNAVAYVVNHNKNTAVLKINYRFRFADQNNVYIGKREGSTYVPPSGAFAVFEPAIDMGHSTPVYVTFEFTEVPEWVFVSEEKINQVKILVSNLNLTAADTSPKLSASIKNSSLFSVPDINVITILYDASKNAVSASRTYVDALNPGESKDINFTWPEPFDRPIVAEEIIPVYNIFLAKLK